MDIVVKLVGVVSVINGANSSSFYWHNIFVVVVVIFLSLGKTSTFHLTIHPNCHTNQVRLLLLRNCKFLVTDKLNILVCWSFKPTWHEMLRLKGVAGQYCYKFYVAKIAIMCEFCKLWKVWCANMWVLSLRTWGLAQSGGGKWIYANIENFTARQCTVLYYVILHCTVLCCTVQYGTLLYCTVLYWTPPHCTVLSSTEVDVPNASHHLCRRCRLWLDFMQIWAVRQIYPAGASQPHTHTHCSALHCSAVQQCSVVKCSTVQLVQCSEI